MMVTRASAKEKCVTTVGFNKKSFLVFYGAILYVGDGGGVVVVLRLLTIHAYATAE